MSRYIWYTLVYNELVVSILVEVRRRWVIESFESTPHCHTLDLFYVLFYNDNNLIKSHVSLKELVAVYMYVLCHVPLTNGVLVISIDSSGWCVLLSKFVQPCTSLGLRITHICHKLLFSSDLYNVHLGMNMFTCQ